MTHTAPKRVLITGMSGKIGTAIAAQFAADGFDIIGVDLREEPLRENAASLASAYNVSVETIPGDLSDLAFAADLVPTAWERFGPLDVLVNCAALVPSTPFTKLTAEVWNRVQDINVTAPTLAIAALGRLAEENDVQATVVNISSGAATRPRPGASHYCTSKAAMEMMTRAAAIELGPRVRVNAISPGFVNVDSPINPVKPSYAKLLKQNPSGRFGEPEDIARAVKWIAGPEADWVTGAVLRVDGGSTAGTLALPLQWEEEPVSAQS